MAKITINKLTKEFNSDKDTIVAVDKIDLSIDDGEFVVFVGPSGCGKTTTLRCIAGLEDVTTGNIHFDDSDVTDFRGRDRDVAMVFQNYALYPHMTVAKNIGFGLRLSTKLSGTEIDERVTKTAQMLGIDDLLESKPKELSGGQQQRVALGRAIIREPKVFLLDEPLSNLDAKLRDQMRTEIQQLQTELDITTVYVTHDQTEAMAMGDRIVVMNDGELQQVGEPDELYLSPNNEFVGSFIGSPSMNIFNAEVDRSNNHRVSLIGPDGFAYELSDGETLGNGDRVRVGIRPEDIEIDDTSGTPVVVKVVESMGDENYIYLELGDRELTARVDRTIRPDVDETVQFTFDIADLYLFDVNSGETLKTKTSDIDAKTIPDSSR